MIDRFEKFSMSITEISRYWRKLATEEMEKYDLKAHECVFLDDMQVNIDGAKRAGMEGILFTTKEEALPKLEMLGVK